jgi:beta-lactamase class A
MSQGKKIIANALEGAIQTSLNMIEKMLIKHIGPLGIRSFRVST